MESSFKFKRFEVSNLKSALKVGTDAVLLGAAMTLKETDRFLLDIGTGTGVIALMAAQRLESSRPFIEAIDIDGASAEEAAQNFAASPWPDCLRAVRTPLAGYVPDKSFHCIFSNPPYYDNSLRNPDEREAVARHTDSLSFAEICAFASEHLTGDGRLSLILPAESEKALMRTAASFSLFPFRIIRVRTTQAKPLKRLIAEFSRSRGAVAEEVLVLMDAGARSSQYSKLTKSFYL